MRTNLKRGLASGIILAMVLFLFAACGATTQATSTVQPSATPDAGATSAAFFALATTQAATQATVVAAAVSQALTAAAPTITSTPSATSTPAPTETPTVTSTPTETVTPTLTPTARATNTPRPLIPTATATPKVELDVSFKIIGYEVWGRPYLDAEGFCQSNGSDKVRMFTVEVIVANHSETDLVAKEWTDRKATNNLGAPAIMSCWYPAPTIAAGQTGLTATKTWVELNQYVSRYSLKIRNVPYERCFDIVPREVPCP